MTPLLWLWWGSLGVKMIVAIIYPVSVDEAYYWVWSYHPQWSYFDHPAMVSWLLWLGHPFEGFGNAVRWPAVVMGHLSLWIWVILLKPHFNESQLTLWLGLALLMPLVGPGGLIVTPDLPLMMFWPLSLLAMNRTIESPHLKNYALLGVTTGMGFLSKYTMAIILPVILLTLWLGKKQQAFRWGGLATSCLCFLGASLPVWIWNGQNGFESFFFQWDHGIDTSKRWTWTTPFEYLLVQIALLTPPLAWVLIRNPIKKAPAWLLSAALFPLGFFLVTSFRDVVEPNWPAVAHPGLLALAILLAKDRKWSAWTAGLWGTAIAMIVTLTIHPNLMGEIYIKTKEFNQYKVFIDLAREKNLFPLYARSYQMAAKMSYELKQPVYKLKGLNRRDFFDSLDESVPKTRYYYLIVKKKQDLPQWAKQRGDTFVATLPAYRATVFRKVRNGQFNESEKDE